jgi:predicted aldo/keto reductase-like oxidoreductase
MLYRKLGKSGREVSILGFGCMRLPIKNGSQSAADILDPAKGIDEEKAIQLIHYAMDQGVNYFDTAYPYHNGKSEPLLGRALQGHREKIMIATKLPAWLVKGEDDFDKFLHEQLQRLNTSYLDFYLLHGLGRQTWSRMKELGALRFLDRILSDGRARYVGFSFHDDIRIFKEIVDGYDWALGQIQSNYLDLDYQAGREGLEYASSRGMGVVIMEPLRGGGLAGKIPGELQALWDTGVSSLVVELSDEKSAEKLSNLRKTLEKLAPPAFRKKSRLSPVLPQLPPESPEPPEEEGGDEDE